MKHSSIKVKKKVKKNNFNSFMYGKSRKGGKKK